MISGCGTGIGGIALLVDRGETNEIDNQKFNRRSSFVALTDADPEALALCMLEKTVYDVLHLSNEIKDPRPRAVAVLKAAVE
jgi:hypothetical protein